MLVAGHPVTVTHAMNTVATEFCGLFFSLLP
jgi:hypothetical protein